MATKKKGSASANPNFPISKILVRKNIRDEGSDKKTDELAASIKSVGLVSPVLLAPLSKPVDGKTHELVYGFRRLEAHKKLKYSTIKATFAPADMTRKQKDASRLIENTDREDLTPIEEARAYKAMMDTHKMTAKQVAQLVGKTDGHISQRLSLLRMPDKVREAVESGHISPTHARQLNRVKDPAKQEKLVDKAAAMTAQAFEEHLDSKLNPEKTPRKKKGDKADTGGKEPAKHQSRKTALAALKKLDTAKAKAADEANKEKVAHLNGVIRGVTWALKLTKNAKLPL